MTNCSSSWCLLSSGYNIPHPIKSPFFTAFWAAGTSVILVEKYYNVLGCSKHNVLVNHVHMKLYKVHIKVKTTNSKIYTTFSCSPKPDEILFKVRLGCGIKWTGSTKGNGRRRNGVIEIIYQFNLKVIVPWGKDRLH